MSVIKKEYLSVEEAADYMSLSKTTVKILMNLGKLKKFYPRPTTPRLKVSDIDAYMARTMKKMRRARG